MTENVRAQVYAKLTMIARELKEAGVEMPDYSGVDSLEDVEEYIRELISSGELEDYTIDALEEIQDTDVAIDQPEEVVDPEMIPEAEGVEEYVQEEQSLDGLTSLSHVCDREKIQYSAVHAAESEYGVDTFSIRVEAQNQAAVDALIANFSGGTCEMQFSYNSSGGFDLNIYNRNNGYEAEELFTEIADVIATARDDVDYLEGLPEDVQTDQIEFVVEHPEVIDSYYTSESLTEVYNDNAEMINDLTDASDNSGVAVEENAIDSDGISDTNVITDIETGEVIAEEKSDEAADLKASLAGANAGMVAASTVVAAVATTAILTAEVVNEAVQTVSNSVKTQVPAMEVAGIVNMFRASANENGTGLDIVIQDDPNNPEQVNVTMKEQGEENKPAITMSCDKDEFSQAKEDMLQSMDAGTIASNKNSDGTMNYRMASKDINDPTTITVISAPPAEVDAIQQSMVKQDTMVKVYTNQNISSLPNDASKGESAFSNLNILIMAFVVAILMIGIVIVFA